MIKIVTINLSKYGSTGNIANSIAGRAGEYDIETWHFFPDEHEGKLDDHDVLIGNYYMRRISRRLCMLSGMNDCGSHIATARILWRIKKLQPDLIHMHNIHSSYLNLSMLFRFIAKEKIPVIWTLHDCWSITGHCPHFSIIGCERWKTGCGNCPIYRSDPMWTYRDKSASLWKLKQKLFRLPINMTIVTPSYWLSNLLKLSYLKDFNIQVIHNGIDLSVFKPCENNIRIKYDIKEKYIVLGVSNGWNDEKGLDVMIELSKRLGLDYKVILAGTEVLNDEMIPASILSIHRTRNKAELAQLYSAADVFVNPSRGDTYPTVNMEAIACGTPVVTFETGGSPEIPDAHSGVVVPFNDIDAMESEIRRVCTEKPFSEHMCLERAKKFDEAYLSEQYCKLYIDILKYNLDRNL